MQKSINTYAENFVHVNDSPYWIYDHEVKAYEKIFSAKYIGWWQLTDKKIVDLFYEYNTRKYFGIYFDDLTVNEVEINISSNDSLIGYKSPYGVVIPKTKSDHDYCDSLALEKIRVKLFNGEFIPIGVTEDV